MAEEFEFEDDDALGLASLADEDAWFFDLPSGAWERQEAKNRALRQNMVDNQRSDRKRKPDDAPLDQGRPEPEVQVTTPRRPMAREAPERPVRRPAVAVQRAVDEIETMFEDRPPSRVAARVTAADWDDEPPRGPAPQPATDTTSSDAERKGLLGRFFKKSGKEGTAATDGLAWQAEVEAPASPRIERAFQAPDDWEGPAAVAQEPPVAAVVPPLRGNLVPAAPGGGPAFGPKLAWNDEWLEAPQPEAPRAPTRLHARAARPATAAAAAPNPAFAPVYPAETAATVPADSDQRIPHAVPVVGARTDAPAAVEDESADDSSSDPWAEFLGRRTANGEQPFKFSNNRSVRRAP